MAHRFRHILLILAGEGVDLITLGCAMNVVLDSPPNRNYDISFGSAKRSKVDKKSTVFLINLSIYYIYGCIKIKDV